MWSPTILSWAVPPEFVAAASREKLPRRFSRERHWQPFREQLVTDSRRPSVDRGHRQHHVIIVRMLTPTEKIWHNGRFIPWEQATIHVLSHVVNYGTSVFEGIRCYSTPSGPAVFRLSEHIRRMVDSAKIYRMENIGYSADQLAEAMLELVRVNRMESCYIRPIVLRGYGEM